ncbi:MAG: MATE family efflux transporter [Sphaerochaetaceae bacterium]
MQLATENKMAVRPVGPLIIGMAFPIMISMMVQALYNIVDSIFIARVSEDALTAVSLAFPVQMLMISVGVGTAIGINSLLSRRLGAGDNKAASQVAFKRVIYCSNHGSSVLYPWSAIYHQLFPLVHN